jgi:hypothetical protein
MTSVRIRFRYQKEFRPELLSQVQECHDNYGIRQVEVDAANRILTVEYDASRLDPAGVTAVLRRSGIPIAERVEAQA